MHARKVIGAAASVALTALFVLGGATATGHTDGLSDRATAVPFDIEPLVAIRTPTQPELIQREIEKMIPNASELGVSFVLSDEETCGEFAAACVFYSMPRTIIFDVTAFSAWGDPTMDTPEDRYIVAHETAHVAQALRWGSFEAAEAALDDAGYGTTTDRDGAPLSSLEAHAECVALAYFPDIAGGYIDTCDPWMAHRAVELLTE
ncbi:hypothetical protein [Microbacterium sp. GXF6406]